MRGEGGYGWRKAPRGEVNDDWQEPLPLFEWPEQEAYEALRTMVLFGSSVAERAAETGTLERTRYRRVERFGKEGMLRLFTFDEFGWLKALKLEGYAPRRPAGPMALQETLFFCLKAI